MSGGLMGATMAGRYHQGIMRSTLLLRCLLLIAPGLIALSAPAQLVRLSFEQRWEGGGGIIFRANSAAVPWNHAGGAITRFDLYYDAGAAVSLGEGAFRLLDPARNFWRMRIETHELGRFEIERPLSTLGWNGHSLHFTHWVPAPYEEVDFYLLVDDADAAALPVPPFTSAPAYLALHSGRAFFDVPDLAEGYGTTSLPLSAAVVPGVDFTPIPEPSTYGAGALIVVGAALARRRRRR